MTSSICFKNLNDSAKNNLFTRCIKINGTWRFAHWYELKPEDLTFKGDDDNTYNVNEIFRIGINDNSLFVYIYDRKNIEVKPEEHPENRCVKVSDKNEINKLMQYLNNNKCNKTC